MRAREPLGAWVETHAADPYISAERLAAEIHELRHPYELTEEIEVEVEGHGRFVVEVFHHPVSFGARKP